MTVTVHDPLLSPTEEDIPQIPVVNEECQPDPPPPYPSRTRRERRRRQQQQQHHQQQASNDSDYASTVPDDDANESTPFLSPRSTGRRPRALSFTSTIISTVSAAPSLAQSAVSFFQSDDDEEEEGRIALVDSSVEAQPYPLLSTQGLKRYFRPLARITYWKAVSHLLFLNFPYALLSWVYLFVFTLTGTAQLMALPVGAVLCFLDLLGARILSRGELFLQSHFHGPLSYPLPYPPRPIFTRYREPTEAESEAGMIGPIKEHSFYKNTYAMFTDSTSYQALFYFLVIKASITILLTILVWIVIPVSLVLVVPAPPIFRATRKLGIWQANVAIEGLYLAVR